MRTFVFLEEKVNLFFQRKQYEMYTPCTKANSQIIPTNINKNGAIVTVRILVEQVIL